MEILICVLVCFVIVSLILIFGSSAKPAATAVPALTPEQQHWMDKVNSLFDNNEAMTYTDIYKACSMYEGQHNPFVGDASVDENTNERFNSYMFAIDMRYRLQHDALATMNDRAGEMHLQANEDVYYRINSVVLYQERVSSYNAVYSGVRWQSGMLRGGSLSVVGNEIRKFRPSDAGYILITNKRVIFVGRQNNVTKAIAIKDILYCNLYQDGVLVNMPNKKPLLFKFDVGYNSEIGITYDGINEFVTVLNRIMNGTESIEQP